MKNTKVQVLLSTYNGEKYLNELLEGLVGQDFCGSIEILVRDDGSHDGTINLLEEHALRYKNISLIRGENLGVIGSFFELLRLSVPDADYYAFCDQDDVWLQGKISRAAYFLDKFPEEVPLMYCSRVFISDEQLKIISASRIPRRGPSFENALVENIATGCTIVINKAARNLILFGSPDPRKIRMHDWWVYLVVSAFGKVIYDEVPSILYRQHASNVFGVKVGLLSRWRARIQRFKKYGRLHSLEQAKEFQRIYGHMLPERKAKILERFLRNREGIVNRLKYAFSCEVYRQSWVDDLILRVLILLGRV